MRKSEKSKLSAHRPVRLKRFLLIVASLLLLQARANLHAETVQNAAAELPSPSIESIEKPDSTYRLENEILYRIRIRWPQLTDDIRMSSPVLEADNLELVAVGQETASDQDHPTGAVEQILTFRFRALGPGQARVNRFSLRWIGASGSVVQTLSIPPLELTITKSWNQWLSLAVMTGGGGLGLLAFLLAAHLRKKKNPLLPSPPIRSHEEQILEELVTAQTLWESSRNHSDFLDGLKKILRGYLRLKFDWNPLPDDYNVLRERAEGKWSKKEAHELMELFQRIEYERFSGAPAERGKVLGLYQAIYSFIERKKIIT